MKEATSEHGSYVVKEATSVRNIYSPPNSCPLIVKDYCFINLENFVVRQFTHKTVNKNKIPYTPTEIGGPRSRCEELFFLICVQSVKRDVFTAHIYYSKDISDVTYCY